jgi:hypothetical protein
MNGGGGTMPIWPALLPPATYLIAIGLLHLRRRPAAVAGGWDAAAVALAAAAAVIVGPLDLLLPSSVTGAWRWGLGLACFALVAVTVQLATRPRLIVYNVSLEQLRPIVAQVATALDPAARWAGETVALPGRDVQVHLDGRGGMRSVSLVTLGSRTSPEGWADFSRRTRRAVRQLRVRPSPWAGPFLAAGAALVAAAVAAAWWSVAIPLPARPADTPSSLLPPSASTGAHHAGSRRPLHA